jgi:1-acyl-sn-glycerol-3-phosphate acyltransferase
MKLPDVGKSSIFYNLVYWPVYLYYHIYYRSFKVIGRENIPSGKPIIYAGNHQNALMDALSILFAARGKVVFLARADMFRRKLIAKILFFFRILPVYRIRDGISTMGQNEGTFQKAAEVLRDGTPLALFPEGNHAGFKRLRSLKKGICRIAFMAEEKSGFTLDLHIIPSGIDYSFYFNPGARLLVKYGKPVRVADFIPLYKENPQKALSALRDKLSEALEPLMINIPSEEHYDTFVNMCEMYRGKIISGRKLRNTHQVKVEIDKEIIATLSRKLTEQAEAFDSFSTDHNSYHTEIKKLGLRDWLLKRKKSTLSLFLLNVVVSIILLPLHLYGFALNYIPYKIPAKYTQRVKDRVFHSSIQFGIGLVLFPFYYLILQVVFSIFVKSFILRLLFAVSLPLSGIFTFYFYKHLLKLRGRYRLLKLRYLKPGKFMEINQQRDQLIEKIRIILD